MVDVFSLRFVSMFALITSDISLNILANFSRENEFWEILQTVYNVKNSKHFNKSQDFCKKQTNENIHSSALTIVNNFIVIEF